MYRYWCLNSPFQMTGMENQQYHVEKSLKFLEKSLLLKKQYFFLRIYAV